MMEKFCQLAGKNGQTRVKELVVNHCVNSQPPLTAYLGGRGVVDLHHTKAGCVQSQPENFVLQNCMEIWE